MPELTPTTSVSDSRSDRLVVLEPATGLPLREVNRCDPGAVDVAVARAKAAHPRWRAINPRDRARMLRVLADRMQDTRDELALLEARNVGKPIGSATGEIDMAIETFRYFSGASERPNGETIPVADGIAFTVREPLGVVGLITPWNFPLAIASWKMAPALAAGNCVVLKPAELTPLTALRFAELVLESGIPEGVLSVIVGPGVTCGNRLVEHPDVAKIAFTGSTEVGKLIAAKGATTLKRVTLELGGKSANIIFEDADIPRAAEAAPAAVFENAGQDCCARSRILVQRGVLEEFLGYLKPAVERIKVGDPLDPKTQMGPLISAGHRDSVAAFVTDGATVAVKGAIPPGPGFWYPPTVLWPVADGHSALRDEIFGPVAVVVPFDSEEEATRLANDTIYGLSGSIWTRDGAKALRVARGVESGNLSVNSHSSVRVNTPFGGFKQSGYGRELGPHATEAYSEVKTVFVDTTG